MLVINGGPFHSLFFTVQKCSLELWESHKKRFVMEFFFLIHRLQLIKKGLHQRFFPVPFLKFFRTIPSRRTFGKCWPSQGLAFAALSKQKIFYLALLMNQQPSQAMRAFSEIAFPQKKVEIFCNNMSMMK